MNSPPVVGAGPEGGPHRSKLGVAFPMTCLIGNAGAPHTSVLARNTRSQGLAHSSPLLKTLANEVEETWEEVRGDRGQGNATVWRLRVVE